MRTWAVCWVFLAFVTSAHAQHNVLLIISDDHGVDRVGAYHEHPDPGHTPNIDALAAQGVLFRNAWGTPVCSSSRACILTGRFGMRTGIGRAIAADHDFELSVDEVSVADLLAPTHRRAVVGKWHLQSNPGHPLDHPLLMGFEHFRGSLNVLDGFISEAYVNHPYSVDGGPEVTSTTYATTETVDDALRFVGPTGEFQEPWFVQVAFHAPHAPFHKPPQNLHTYNLPANIANNIPIHMQAMVEAMDTEIGRLLATIPPAVMANTYVIFVGDNGTDKPAVTAPFDPNKAKKTIYEGGINVPLIITGPGVVAGAEATGLVTLTDLFATIADMAGVSAPMPFDSVSMFPYLSDPGQPSIRDWAFAEIYEDNGWGPYPRFERTARDMQFKLLRFYSPYNTTVYTEQFYDLLADPFETIDLLTSGPLSGAASASYAQLTRTLNLAFEPWTDMGHGLAGTNGVPKLSGTGTLVPTTPYSLKLEDGLANTLAVLFAGIDVLDAPFSGGLLVPNATVIKFLGTNAQGKVTLAGSWPTGIPAGLMVYTQYWLVDSGGPVGLSASNALRFTARSH